MVTIDLSQWHSECWYIEYSQKSAVEMLWAHDMYAHHRFHSDIQCWARAACTTNMGWALIRMKLVSDKSTVLGKPFHPILREDSLGCMVHSHHHLNRKLWLPQYLLPPTYIYKSHQVDFDAAFLSYFKLLSCSSHLSFNILFSGLLLVLQKSP